MSDCCGLYRPFSDRRTCLELLYRFGQSSSSVNYVVQGIGRLFYNNRSKLSNDVSVYITDPIERSGYVNAYLHVLESVLIDIIQMPRVVLFDLGIFVVPHVLTKVSVWCKQILLLLLNVLVVSYDNKTKYPT